MRNKQGNKLGINKEIKMKIKKNKQGHEQKNK